MASRSSVTALALVKGLRTMLAVTYVPLAGNVAQLDTTTPVWLLELDVNSSAEDHCWAMIDVLRVLSSGAQAAESARPSRRLRLVPD